MARTNPRLSVTIRPDQADWLREHPEINISGLLQAAIDHEMRRE